MAQRDQGMRMLSNDEEDDPLPDGELFPFSNDMGFPFNSFNSFNMFNELDELNELNRFSI